MADLDLPYKTTFAAQIRAIEPSDSDIKEAKASLADLRGLLPAGIDPEETPQLLYIAANLYVGGMVNLNDDGVDIATSLATYKGFEKQQLNIEHDRKRIAGYILHAGLSEFGTDRIITEDEARAANKPFNIAVVAALWKVANRELCSYLMEASNPLHPDYKQLSLSFEVGFSSYSIGIIDSATRIISQAKKIITPTEPEFDTMNKYLRSNGGTGKLPGDKGEGVYQILSGSILPLGGGIVTMPAAAVKGIITITEPINQEQDIKKSNLEKEEANKIAEKEKANKLVVDDMKLNLSKLMTFFEKRSLSRIINTKTRVSSDTSQTTQSNMKSLKEIKEAMASAKKPEELQEIVASVSEIVEVISAASEKLANELEAEKNRSAEIEKNRAEAEAANAELKKNFDAIKAEVDALRAQQVAAELEAQFNERMATIEEIFDLDDESRSFFAKMVKKCDDDNDEDDDEDIKNEKDNSKKKAKRFEKKVAEMKKLMPEKTKEFKKKQLEDKKKKTDEMKAALAAKGVQVTIDEEDVIKEVLASAKENNISDGIGMNTIEGAKSLVDQMKEEFLENVSFGGRPLKDLQKK